MVAMLPAVYVGMKQTAHQGIEFVNDTDDRSPIARARRGEVARRVEESFASALRSLADEDHDLVLDLVLYDPASLWSCVRVFQGIRTYFLGVRCDLTVLEAREFARGDRFPNLSRSQHLVVHEFARVYDFEVDTTSTGPHQLASVIVEHAHANQNPHSFARLATEGCDGSPAVYQEVAADTQQFVPIESPTGTRHLWRAAVSPLLASLTCPSVWNGPLKFRLFRLLCGSDDASFPLGGA
jgi:chloramphenicol 3-O phosphotransferase